MFSEHENFSDDAMCLRMEIDDILIPKIAELDSVLCAARAFGNGSDDYAFQKNFRCLFM